MITLDRATKKQAALSRALDLRIRKPVPRAVVTWARDHLGLPQSDIRRMKKLYDKVMDETITQEESTELDGLLEACAAMDLLRARMVIGTAGKAKARRE